MLKIKKNNVFCHETCKGCGADFHAGPEIYVDENENLYCEDCGESAEKTKESGRKY